MWDGKCVKPVGKFGSARLPQVYDRVWRRSEARPQSPVKRFHATVVQKDAHDRPDAHGRTHRR